MLLTLCADLKSIGRFDITLLSDQQRMEMFFTPDCRADAQTAFVGDESDACTWIGVQCDENRNVFEIDWQAGVISLFGSIDLPMLPTRLRVLRLFDQNIRGKLTLTELPETLEFISVERTLLHGTLDFGYLPPKMVEVYFAFNLITVIQNMCNFPATLQWINIEEHQIKTKEVHIGVLPPDFTVISVDAGCLKRITFENPSDKEFLIEP